MPRSCPDRGAERESACNTTSHVLMKIATQCAHTCMDASSLGASAPPKKGRQPEADPRSQHMSQGWPEACTLTHTLEGEYTVPTWCVNGLCVCVCGRVCAGGGRWSSLPLVGVSGSPPDLVGRVLIGSAGEL